MTLRESQYPRDWCRIAAIAAKDLVRAERALRDGDPDLAGFCLQQAGEKYLKAFLLAHGWQLRRIHDLEALLDDAVVYDPGLALFRSVCQQITGYYVLERYPLLGMAGPTEQDVRTAMLLVRQLAAQIERAIP